MRANNTKCACYKTCKDCSDFHKVVNLKNIGLIIYRYPSRDEDAIREQGILPKSTNIKSDIIIVHNTRNVDITADQYLSEFEKYKICPRCKYILDHTQKLLEKIPQIRRLDTVSICDHCLNRISIPCEKCSEIVKMFNTSKIHKKKLLTEILLWLSNKNKLLGKSKQLSQLERRSQSYSDNLRNISLSPRSVRQPQIGELNRFVDSVQADIRPEQTYFSRKPTFIERPIQHKSKSILLSKDDRNIAYDIKIHPQRFYHSDEHLSFSLDGTLRQNKMKNPLKLNIFDLENGTVISSPSMEPVVLKDIINGTPYGHKDRSTRTILPRSQTQSSNFKILQNEEISPFIQHRYNLGEPINKDFDYLFIKEKKKELEPASMTKSSSELIKDIQDRLNEKIEEDVKTHKEITVMKLEDQPKKQLGELDRKKIEEKNNLKIEKTKMSKRHDEEKKILNVEKKKTIKEEEKKSLTNEKEIHTDKSLKESSKKIEKEKKNVVSHVLKSSAEFKKKSETKSNYDTKVSETENKRTQNEKEKRDREENIRLEKERKLKEKEEKENLKREKQEKMRKEKEVMQKIKEEKLREKEESRREKKDDKVKKEPEEKIRSDNYMQELKKMRAEETKRKENEIKSQQEEEKKRQIELGKEIAKKEAELKLKMMRQSESEKVEKPVEEKISEKSIEEPTIKEININEVKIRKSSTDDLIIKLVKLKQSEKLKKRPRNLSELNIPRMSINAHKAHKNKKSDCVICNDSDLELDIENIVMTKMGSKEITDIIIGQKILRNKPILEEKTEDSGAVPIYFKTKYQEDRDVINFPQQIFFSNKIEDMENKPLQTVPTKYVEQEVPKGVIRYALSDRSFIEKGWTMLPTEKVVRKMNVYRMRPAHPEFDWFEHNKSKKIMCYDTGEKLAEFDDNGRGRWFYRNGRLALDYYDAEEINAQQRCIIHSSGDLDERGRSRPLVILATFDYLGNGIVFDHAGKIRLKYNQTEGVVLDRNIGPVSHWKWHTLNDPPVLQQVMIDTQMAHKDPQLLKLGGSADDKTRPDNEEMLAIEFDNFIKEKSKKLSQKFKPFQIKMKALKINEHFSLKVLDQATVYLIFRDGTTNLKMNMGMILDHKEIVDTDTAEVGEVSNSLERFPARTQSLAILQRSVAHAQRVERARIERESRLRPAEPCSSADKLTAATSRPLRVPLHVAASSSITSGNRYCRKPPSCNLYYDTRLS